LARRSPDTFHIGGVTGEKGNEFCSHQAAGAKAQREGRQPVAVAAGKRRAFGQSAVLGMLGLKSFQPEPTNGYWFSIQQAWLSLSTAGALDKTVGIARENKVLLRCTRFPPDFAAYRLRLPEYGSLYDQPATSNSSVTKVHG